MDAVEFLKAKAQMCRSYMRCQDCPLGPGDCETFVSAHPLKAIEAVEKWTEAHRKTRQSVFLKRYPNAKTDEDGVLNVCPILIEGGDCDKYNGDDSWCLACKRNFWTQEADE